jgi:hypothetical protein
MLSYTGLRNHIQNTSSPCLISEKIKVDAGVEKKIFVNCGRGWKSFREPWPRVEIFRELWPRVEKFRELWPRVGKKNLFKQGSYQHRPPSLCETFVSFWELITPFLPLTAPLIVPLIVSCDSSW